MPENISSFLPDCKKLQKKIGLFLIGCHVAIQMDGPAQNGGWHVIDCSPAPGGGGGPQARKNIIAALKKMPNGAICAVQVMKFHSGHVFIAERVNGKTVFRDPQAYGTESQLNAFDELKNIKPEHALVCRLDNLKFNAKIKECCQRRSK